MQASSPRGRDRAQEMGRPEMQQEQPSWNSCRGAFTCTLSCFSPLVQLLSRVQLFAAPWTAAHKASLSITNSCPLSWQCHPTISSSVVPFSCLQSFPASSLPVSQFFLSGGQIIGVSASASVLPMNYSGLISFRINWFDLLPVQGILKRLLQHHNSKVTIQSNNSSALSLLYAPALISVHDH